MKKVLLLIGLFLLFLGCSDEVKKPDFYVTKILFNSDSEEKIRETIIYDETYIELRIVESHGGGYEAHYNLPNEDNEDGSYTFGGLVVTNNKGVILTYETPIDFLNFMDNLNYEMTNEKKSKYGSSIYTFKKK